MTTGRPGGQELILFCNCVHYDVIPSGTREQVLHSLSRSGVQFEAVADLCGLAADRDPRLQTWAQASSLTIIACFPRGVRWLFHAAGVSLPEDSTRFFNMRTQSAPEILDGLSLGENKSEPSDINHKSQIANDKSDWVPWFPVIDYDRCINCRQCMNFCLFGTYGLSAEGKVQVVKPSGCKTNCPACARMCPRQAIIFPKYPDAPINGDAVAEGAGPEGGQPQPAAPAGDLYDRIRNRSGKRFSTQADANRSCPTLDSLKRELNIPDEVLASLSPAEMQRVLARSKADADNKKGENPHE
jgi:Pyruvate/2-oxoacid:ferredoxin oxidoreductase delta subunit